MPAHGLLHGTCLQTGSRPRCKTSRHACSYLESVLDIPTTCIRQAHTPNGPGLRLMKHASTEARNQTMALVTCSWYAIHRRSETHAPYTCMCRLHHETYEINQPHVLVAGRLPKWRGMLAWRHTTGTTTQSLRHCKCASLCSALLCCSQAT